VTAQITWGIHEGPVIPCSRYFASKASLRGLLPSMKAKEPWRRQKPLKLGDTVGNDFVVLDGLKPGDHLITSGPHFCKDGMPDHGADFKAKPEQFSPVVNSNS